MKSSAQTLTLIILFIFHNIHGLPLSGTLHFSIVSDLDHESKTENGLFQSFLRKGTLSWEDGKWNLEMKEMHSLTSRINDGQRGMELSDLVYFNGKLLTCDDRTGLIYEITSSYKVFPRFVLANGGGSDDNTFKCEWMTVKDDKLYIGSYGNEFIENFKIKDYNFQWIKAINSEGGISHIFWRSCYEKLREYTGTTYPGYLLHEAVDWNPHSKEWYFLPRRASKYIYDPVLDEGRGTNIVLIANEDCTSIRSSTSGILDFSKGVSSVKLLDSEGTAIILKTYETLGKTESFLSITNLITGNIMMEDVSLGYMKYEGIAIDNINV